MLFILGREGEFMEFLGIYIVMGMVLIVGGAIVVHEVRHSRKPH